MKFLTFYAECEARLILAESAYNIGEASVKGWLAKKMGNLAVAASLMGSPNASADDHVLDQEPEIKNHTQGIPLDPSAPKYDGQQVTVTVIPAGEKGKYVVCWSKDEGPVKIEGKPYTIDIRFQTLPQQGAKKMMVQGYIRVQNGKWWIASAKAIDYPQPAKPQQNNVLVPMPKR